MSTFKSYISLKGLKFHLKPSCSEILTLEINTNSDRKENLIVRSDAIIAQYILQNTDMERVTYMHFACRWSMATTNASMT